MRWSSSRVDHRRRLLRHRQRKHLEFSRILSTVCEQPSTTQHCKRLLRSVRSQRCSRLSNSRGLRTSSLSLERTWRRRVRMIRFPFLVDKPSLVSTIPMSLVAVPLTSKNSQMRSDKTLAHQQQPDPPPPPSPRLSYAPPSWPPLPRSRPPDPAPVPPSPPSPPPLFPLSSLPCPSPLRSFNQEHQEQTQLHRRTEEDPRQLVRT